MAGYAAVISLKQTIERILDSCRYFLVPPSPEIIGLAWTQPLKRTLEKLDSSSISKSRKKVNALDGEIKEAVWRLEDVLETLLYDQILSQSKSSEADLLLFTIDLQSLQPDVDSFIKAVKDLEVKYIYELENMGELEEDELGLSTIHSGGDMVGFSPSFKNVKTHLMKKCGILGLNKYGFFDKIRVYSWWSHLFNREASKDKFLHVLTSGTDFLGGGIKGQRRLCLHSNFIFNFKEVHNSVKCDRASTTRSLLCLGPYHRHSMPFNVGFKLLRVLNAIRVRFYNFPFEILELVLLQYLSLACNGELPTSISRLFNLEFLIICPHMHIKSCGAPSYMPIGIWDMQELKCIQINGSNLPNPNSAASLQKLASLLAVSRMLLISSF